MQVVRLSIPLPLIHGIIEGGQWTTLRIRKELPGNHSFPEPNAVVILN